MDTPRPMYCVVTFNKYFPMGKQWSYDICNEQYWSREPSGVRFATATEAADAARNCEHHYYTQENGDFQ